MRLNEQSLILPTGSAKIGTREYRVEMNNTPNVPEAFNNLPVKTVNGTTIYLHDVAQVRDGAAVQTNIVRHDGRRGALLTVLKNGDASTIEIVSKIKAALPRILSSLPPAFHVTTLFDQSIFVRAAINGVVKEAVVAAMLTGIMILLFLGSWRSTLIVCISIPLSILTSLAVLYAMGETINIMTLGGLALAVGILVDDATVEIENIHRNLGMGKGVIRCDSRRRAPDRRSRLRFDAVHLHRVRAGVIPDRRGAISVYAPGAGRRARDVRVLSAVAHPGAHHDPLPDSRRIAALSGSRRRSRRDRRGPHLARPSCLSSRLRASARGLFEHADVRRCIIASWCWSAS